MLVGVVKRGKYGERLIETIKERTNFRVISVEVPVSLPGFIEDPESFMEGIVLNPELFKADILILYTFHPDITPEIVKKAGESGVKAIIIPGGIGRAGSINELRRIAEKYGTYIEVDEICCTLDKCGVEVVDAFVERLGMPEFQVRTSDGLISSIKVLRGSPCGGTWHVAQGLQGKTVEEAPALAGLLCQQYPCRAVRGTPGGIHTSADLHRHALEEAIGLKTELNLPGQSRPIKIDGRKGNRNGKK
ncbi:MAG: DUF166 domain-containing protein [Methanotrichaceae archaeon]|nr:DUF166 domain-containing protein [Methanotrichaceae archaeon]